MSKKIEFDGTEYDVEVYVQGMVMIKNLRNGARLPIPATDIINLLEKGSEIDGKPFSKKYELFGDKIEFVEINIDKHTKEGLTIVNLIITDNKHAPVYLSDVLSRINIRNILKVAAVSISQDTISKIYEESIKESAN